MTLSWYLALSQKKSNLGQSGSLSPFSAANLSPNANVSRKNSLFALSLCLEVTRFYQEGHVCLGHWVLNLWPFPHFKAQAVISSELKLPTVASVYDLQDKNQYYKDNENIHFHVYENQQ